MKRFTVTIDVPDSIEDVDTYGDVSDLLYGIDDGAVMGAKVTIAKVAIPDPPDVNDYTARLLQARASWQSKQDGKSLDAVHKAQAEYDAHVPECQLPNRPMTSYETAWLTSDLLRTMVTVLRTDQCKVGDCFSKPECDTCMRLHNAIFCDPNCVDHG
jgi:hypothetical protein